MKSIGTSGYADGGEGRGSEGGKGVIWDVRDRSEVLGLVFYREVG